MGDKAKRKRDELVSKARRRLTLDEALLLDAGGDGEGLRDALGDRWLVANNPVVGNVRRALLSLGFRLSDQPPYERGLALLSLPEILRTRCVAYSPSAIAVRALAAARPNRFTIADAITVGLARQTVTHESTHCVAHALRAYADNASAEEPAARRRYVLTTQLAEACANAAELVGNAFLDSDAHVALYSFNSYIVAPPKIQERLRRLLDALGLAETFHIAALGYLAANFLWQDPDDDAIDALLRHAPPLDDKPLRKAARKLVREACKLSLPFRVGTAALHFRSLGIDDGIFPLLAFDFLEVLQTDPRYTESLLEIAQRVSG